MTEFSVNIDDDAIRRARSLIDATLPGGTDLAFTRMLQAEAISVIAAETVAVEDVFAIALELAAIACILASDVGNATDALSNVYGTMDLVRLSRLGEQSDPPGSE